MKQQTSGNSPTSFQAHGISPPYPCKATKALCLS
jgi:hypothetical protein